MKVVRPLGIFLKRKGSKTTYQFNLKKRGENV
jgi:hypothetical protein